MSPTFSQYRFVLVTGSVKFVMEAFTFVSLSEEPNRSFRRNIYSESLNLSSPNSDENEISLYVITTRESSDENKGSDHQG